MAHTPKYYETLTDETRERLFAAMRNIDTRAQSYLERGYKMGRGTGMSIPVGAAHFDEIIRGEGLSAYLRALRTGLCPTDAEGAAKAESRSIIKSHNSKRAKDVCWQRADMAVDSIIETAHHEIVNAVINR